MPSPAKESQVSMSHIYDKRNSHIPIEPVAPPKRVSLAQSQLGAICGLVARASTETVPVSESATSSVEASHRAANYRLTDL